MAQIGVNTMHKWATGEVVTADNMNVNQDILRTAINDTDTRVTNLNIFGIAAGNITASLAGSLLDPNTMTFNRNSIAYGKNASVYPFGAMRTAQGKYGQGAFIEEGTTNLLTANQSNIEIDTSGFDTGATFMKNAGASMVRDTSVKKFGTSSLKITTTAAIVLEGVETNAVSALANTKYTCSAYVKGTAGVVLLINMRDYTNEISGFAVPITLTDDWSRFEVTITTGSLAVTDLRMCVLTNSAQATTFWIDGLQIEKSSYATSFIDGGTTRQSETLSYTLSQPLSSRHFGCLIWKPDQASTVANTTNRRTLMYAPNLRYSVHYQTDTKTFVLFKSPDVAITSYTCQSSVINFNAHDQIFVAWMDDPASGVMNLWVGVNDGTLQKTSTANAVQISGVTTWYVGTRDVAGYEANGTFDVPIVSDTIPTNEQVEALYRAAEIGGNRHFPNPTQLLNQQAWISPTLVNGWVNFATDYETVAYMKDSLGFVHLKGTIKNGTTTSGTVLFTLPVGFRPKSRLLFDTDSNGSYGRVDILPTGEVLLILGSDTSTTLNISTFRAEQ